MNKKVNKMRARYYNMTATKHYIYVLLFLASMILFSCGSVPTDLAPDFTTQRIDGSEFTLSDLRGDYVLLDFWGSWCPPCRRDNPNLVKLHNAFSDVKFKDGSGFSIVTVALEKNNKSWEKAAKRDGFIWDNQIVEISKIVMLSSLAQKYGVKDIPAKFLIGPKGEILGVNQSYEELRTFLMGKK